MHGSRNVMSKGIQLCQQFFFLLFKVDVRRGLEDPNTTKSGVSPACWRADKDPKLNADLVHVALRFSRDPDQCC